MTRWMLKFVVPCCALLLGWLSCVSVACAEAPSGFRSLFNGRDLTGWYGLNEDPRKLWAKTPDEQAAQREASLADIQQHWSVQNRELVNDGFGLYLTTVEEFGDYELWIDYKTVAKADSGIYLRGVPQVQIWDSTEEDKFKIGADKGSGGLWNNSPGAAGKDPLAKVDRAFGEWNRFRIVQVGTRTTVYLNDVLVVDHARHENYWDRTQPLFRKGPIQLQTHGGEIRWKDIYIRELTSEESSAWLRTRQNAGFKPLFNGHDLTGWSGAVDDYEVLDGAIRCRPGKGGVLHTAEMYADFVARVEFKLPPGGNNGLAIRYPGAGDAAYAAMTELQILDNDSPKYSQLDPRQYHGSAYGMAPALRGFLRPTGEWNFQEVTVRGSKITVELNGNVILETDVAPITDYMANSPHPGKDRTEGYFGFAGHTDPVEFRAVSIRSLTP